ncbi:amidase [Homoserinibacter sp. GY 40078]|uniref:amidase n=1 Tax=Homoserinibacter sp. GY 40078 TaxID=2603275 RepID=UPI0011CA7D66|nr:amidase [Homoserinibacter sp. GY 40078]TXK17235.1 amidase [Homoserinibacter sp. GY 40078]
MFELHHLTAVEQLDWLRRGEITSRELTEHYLARIERLDPELGAFTVVDSDAGLLRAEATESLSRALPLWGLPTADKDLVARAGRVSAFGSRAFAGRVADESDELAIVLDATGAVSLGSTAAPEFGFPSYTEPLAGRPASNPYDVSLGAGGSSGGAAVAVAAGLLPVAPGSDGGGSIRIPAAATGLVGLKPSRGRIAAASGFGSLGGLVVAGPLARTVADAGLLLDAFVAPSGSRSQWATEPPADRDDDGPFLSSATRGEGRFQLAVSVDSPWASAYDIRLDPEARAALDLAVREFVALGHGVDELALPEEPGYSPAFRAVWQAGAATLPLDDAQLALVEPLTRWLVEQGRELDARTLGEALAWLAGYERRIVALLAPFDAVLMPSLALTPRPIGWYDSEDGERNFAQQVEYTPFTSFANVAGLPAITLPVHTTPDGLPMGVQLVGRPGGERTLLALGAQLERRLRWHRRHPPAWVN